MREQGIITKILGDKLAQVEFEAGAACAKCKACCHLVETGKMVVEARNEIGAKVGDKVEVHIPEKQVLTSAFLVYIFPLICLIGGYFLGIYLSRTLNIFVDSEILGIGVGFVGMVVAFWGMGAYDKIIAKKKSLVKIVSILCNAT